MLKKYGKGIITALICFTIAIILTWVVPNKAIYNIAKAAETDKEEFQGASGKSGDLEWNITAEGHLTIEGTGDYKRDFYNDTYDKYMPEWLKYNEYIKTAEVKVQDITSTRNMFSYCSSLTNLDLSNFNTDNVTDMGRMFSFCSSLTSLDLSNFNTDNVTDIAFMFNECSSLTSLDLSNFNTDKVTSMEAMFQDCNSLTSLNISNFNTNNVTDMCYMFSICSKLTSLDISNFNTDNVTDMNCMFQNCSSLTSLNVNNFNTDNVTDMYYMFKGCSGLTSLDVSNFNTDNVTNMFGMFLECSDLTSLDVSNFNTDNVTDMTDMFFRCNSLTSLDVSNFNTNNVTGMGGMFFDCNSLTSLDISNFNTDNVTDMGRMFSKCNSLTSLDLSNFNTDNVTDMFGMFSDCSSLTSLNLSNFNDGKIEIEIYDNEYFSGPLSLDGLYSLEKLNFFANSSIQYNLPSSYSYYWVNDNQEVVTKTAKAVDRKVNYFRIESDNTGIYADSTCASLASISARTLFVYGGNVKQTDGSKINYKSKNYYTKLQASNIVTVDKKGKTRTKKGKLVVGVTSTNTKPSLVKGKVSKDVAASKIAKASISKGKIKVTAGKESGVVYVWVMDTGDIGDYVYAKFVVNAAPSKLQIFARASSDATFSADKKNVYKKDGVEIGGSVRLYVYPTYKQNGQFKETKDASYSASINTQAASYFTVTQDENNPYCFIVTANGLKNNKKTTGKVTIKCNENGRKTVFTAIAVNGIQSISFDSASGMTLDTTSGSAVTSYIIERSDTDKKTGSFVISTSKSSDSFDTTDKVKIYAMGMVDGFDKAMMEKGRVRITSKPSGNQKKLVAKVGSDKKTITVTAAKKIPAQTSVYYLVFYNNKQNKGYSVVKITTK